MIASAAVDARADVAVVEKRMQGRDHPVLMTVPETYYLKCFILQKAGVGLARVNFQAPNPKFQRSPL